MCAFTKEKREIADSTILLIAVSSSSSMTSPAKPRVLLRKAGRSPTSLPLRTWDGSFSYKKEMKKIKQYMSISVNLMRSLERQNKRRSCCFVCLVCRFDPMDQMQTELRLLERAHLELSQWASHLLRGARMSLKKKGRCQMMKEYTCIIIKICN